MLCNTARKSKFQPWLRLFKILKFPKYDQNFQNMPYKKNLEDPHKYKFNNFDLKYLLVAIIQLSAGVYFKWFPIKYRIIKKKKNPERGKRSDSNSDV